ncbi:9943_t:CDS:2, partial [Acaulospora morrowiae]
MSLPDDTLRKVLFELQNRLVDNKRQLTTVTSQIQSKEREKRMAELTKKELSTLELNTRTYKSVGKAFIRTDLSVLTAEIDTRISQAEAELAALDKSKKYYERNVNESTH